MGWLILGIFGGGIYIWLKLSKSQRGHEIKGSSTSSRTGGNLAPDAPSQKPKVPVTNGPERPSMLSTDVPSLPVSGPQAFFSMPTEPIIMRMVPGIPRFVVLDFETTGLSPDHGAEVIEVSAREVVGGVERREFRTLVAAEDGVPYEIAALTGITSEMLRVAPVWTFVMEELFNFIGKDPIVAHNASFELRFLNSYAGRLGREAELNTLCTIRLSRRLFPNHSSYKLGLIANALDIRGAGTLHRASADTHLTLRLFDRICCTLQESYGRDDVHLEMLIKAQARAIGSFGGWIRGLPRAKVEQPTPQIPDYQSKLLAQGVFLEAAQAAQNYFTVGAGKGLSSDAIAKALEEIATELREPVASESRTNPHMDESSPMSGLADTTQLSGIAGHSQRPSVTCRNCNMLYRINVIIHLIEKLHRYCCLPGMTPRTPPSGFAVSPSRLGMR